MKSEAEIRKRRDQMREALSMVEDPSEKPEDVQVAIFFMQSHELLLSWVLDECEDVEAVHQGLESGLNELISEN